MKTLVIHPSDRSTEFLEAVYAKIEDKTVIRCGLSRSDLMEMIMIHDRIMMMGHGSPFGLLAMGLFSETGIYIIDQEIAPLLKSKQNSVFIWCYAARFVEEHGLNGWYSDMFVSEVGESISVGLKGIDHAMVERSNRAFGRIAGHYIHYLNPKKICEHVKRDYEVIAAENACARYNLERLGYKMES